MTNTSSFKENRDKQNEKLNQILARSNGNKPLFEKDKKNLRVQTIELKRQVSKNQKKVF